MLIRLTYRLLWCCGLFLFINTLEARGPVWTFTPLTATSILIPGPTPPVIQYRITNQSRRNHTLAMRTIAGVRQIATSANDCAAEFTLAYQQSCVLNLQVESSEVNRDIIGGPIVCDRANNLQCYQPNPANLLRIIRNQQQYTVTAVAGPNGAVSPSTQVVSAGKSVILTATPVTDYAVHEWLVNGELKQIGGTRFELTQVVANQSVSVTFGQDTFSSSISSLALSVRCPLNSSCTVKNAALTGNPRQITVTNRGALPATNLQVSYVNPPAGTTISDNCGSTLNAGDFCVITVTPGPTASSSCNTAPGSAPAPAFIRVDADDAAAAGINTAVLGFGCIYQSGYLFAIDDTTPNTGSIAGKVISATDVSPGNLWENGRLINTGASSNTNGTNTPPNGNTYKIINAQGAGTYAANTCAQYRAGGYSNWYLPAICEMGIYTGIGENMGCGNSIPNVYVNLQQRGFASISGNYWSSTEYPFDPVQYAMYQYFAFPGFHDKGVKNFNLRVRCARSFPN